MEEGIGSNGPQSGSVVDGSKGLDVGVSKQAVKQLETVKSLCADKQYEKHDGDCWSVSLQQSSKTDCWTFLEDIWKFILGPDKVLQLPDIVCASTLSMVKKLYNVETRKIVISNSKRLKDSTFRNVFNNRDLTYNQRRELFRRRNLENCLDI